MWISIITSRQCLSVETIKKTISRKKKRSNILNILIWSDTSYYAWEPLLVVFLCPLTVLNLMKKTFLSKRYLNSFTSSMILHIHFDNWFYWYFNDENLTTLRYICDRSWSTSGLVLTRFSNVFIMTQDDVFSLIFRDITFLIQRSLLDDDSRCRILSTFLVLRICCHQCSNTTLCKTTDIAFQIRSYTCFSCPSFLLRRRTFTCADNRM